MTQSGDRPHRVNPSFDKRIDALASARRRCILYYLLDTDDGIASLDDLIDDVLEHDPSASDRETVATSLYHIHLPKLRDTGLIDYDDRSETVRYEGQTRVDEILDTARELEFDD